MFDLRHNGKPGSRALGHTYILSPHKSGWEKVGQNTNTNRGRILEEI